MEWRRFLHLSLNQLAPRDDADEGATDTRARPLIGTLLIAVSKDTHVSHFSSIFSLSSSKLALNSSSSEAGSLFVRRPRAILPSRSCCSSCASWSSTSALVSRFLILSVAIVRHFGKRRRNATARARFRSGPQSPRLPNKPTAAKAKSRGSNQIVLSQLSTSCEPDPWRSRSVLESCLRVDRDGH
jgi:hypothetical protein